MPEITVFAGYLTAAALLAGPARNAPGQPVTVLALSVAALSTLAHGWLLANAVLATAPDHLSFGNTISLSGWMLAAIAVAASLRSGNRALAAVFITLAAITVTATTHADAGPGGSQAIPVWQFLSHALLATLSWSLFAAAATLALLTAAKDRYLRQSGAAGWAAALPPLESMERMMFVTIGAGFALLSLAIFSGLIFVDNLRAQHLTHKTVLTAVAWCLFAILLLGRWRLGWRGRRAINWTVGSFAVLALAYFGSRLVLEVVLGRHWG